MANLTNTTKENLINFQIKFYLKMENTNQNQTLLNREDTLKFLEQNKIEYFIEDHEQANTVQEGLEKVKTEKIKPEDYTFVKNLFLKNKAGGFYLITAHHATTTDFKILHKLFKAKNGNIRNAEKDQLQTYLKVAPGSVNPFCLINLEGNQKNEVKFCFDKAITTEYIAVHPMINTSTVFLKTKSLLNLLEQNKIQVEIMEIKDTEEEKDNNNKEEKKPAEKKQTEKPKKAAEKKEVDESKSKLAVSCGKEEDFSTWYSDTIIKSEMIEYYDISGCYILRPWSYSIWEIIQKYFDDKIKELGVENSCFPLFVSEKALNKEKDHVEGFSPEVAWVTKSGDKNLENPIAIRPTSETIMYPAFSKWIRSHRDLPLKLNQWTNVVRWEFKNPTPFIRTREFLWQEGHTAHDSLDGANEMVFQILEFYRQVYEELLAVPVIPGRKTENEKFAGGYFTTTVETMIPANGKGIQGATSHNLGQNFSKMFEISYLNEKKESHFAWQTSWGMTTRTIGVMVMTHGDDIGLVLPPRIAPVQVVLIPIITTKDNPELIKDKLFAVAKKLKEAGVKTKLDDSDLHNPGWKFSHWELKGVPIRIEFGAKDMEKEQVTVVCRDNKEKFVLKYDEVNDRIKAKLEEIQMRMFTKAKNDLDKRTFEAYDYDVFIKNIANKNMVLTPWCENKECEENVKKRVKASYDKSSTDEDNSVATAKTLCIPIKQEPLKDNDICFFCGEKAKIRVFWGRTY
jgi:prolyl-tRNA synthetase